MTLELSELHRLFFFIIDILCMCLTADLYASAV